MSTLIYSTVDLVFHLRHLLLFGISIYRLSLLNVKKLLPGHNAFFQNENVISLVHKNGR